MSGDYRRDRVFAKRLSEVRAFEFDEAVAGVFEDMMSRSVPGYSLLLRMIGLYADVFVTDGSSVYDLGCSLGAASLVVAGQTGNLVDSAVDEAGGHFHGSEFNLCSPAHMAKPDQSHLKA